MLQSSHTYLNPWHNNTPTVKQNQHNPYLLVESSRNWNVILIAIDGMILVLKHTPTNCKGFAGVYTAAAGLQAYPLIATQLATLVPTRICMERLGIRVQNTSPTIALGGSFYALTTANMPDLTFDADNVGDPYLRLTLAATNTLVSKVISNPYTRTISNATINTRPLTRITSVLKPGFEFGEYVDVDSTDNASNITYEVQITTSDVMDLTSTTILIWPIDGLVKTLNFQMRSQDGCVFDVEHGLYSSCKHSPVVSNVVHTNLHQHALTTTRSGTHDHVSVPVPAHGPELSLASKIEGAFNFAEEAKNVVGAVYNGAKRLFRGVETGVSYARRAAPLVEEIEEAAPLLLA